MPMHRWMARAAGGISQRLNPAPATMRSRPSHPSSIFASPARIRMVHAVVLSAVYMKPPHTYRGVVMSRPVKPVAARNPASAGPAKVRVGREVAGRGGKGVTVITGLPLDAVAL